VISQDSDIVLHHRAVRANPLQYGDSGVERQRLIEHDYAMLKAVRDGKTSKPKAVRDGETSRPAPQLPKALRDGETSSHAPQLLHGASPLRQEAVPWPSSVRVGILASSSGEAPHLFASSQTPVEVQDVLGDEDHDDEFSADNDSDESEHDLTDAEVAEYRRRFPGPTRDLFASEFGPESANWSTMTRKQRRLYHQRKASVVSGVLATKSLEEDVVSSSSAALEGAVPPLIPPPLEPVVSAGPSTDPSLTVRTPAMERSRDVVRSRLSSIRDGVVRDKFNDPEKYPTAGVHTGIHDSRLDVIADGGSRPFLPLGVASSMCRTTVLDIGGGQQTHFVHPIDTVVTLTSEGEILTTPIEASTSSVSGSDLQQAAVGGSSVALAAKHPEKPVPAKILLADFQPTPAELLRALQQGASVYDGDVLLDSEYEIPRLQAQIQEGIDEGLAQQSLLEEVNDDANAHFEAFLQSKEYRSAQDSRDDEDDSTPAADPTPTAAMLASVTASSAQSSLSECKGDVGVPSSCDGVRVAYVDDVLHFRHPDGASKSVNRGESLGRGPVESSSSGGTLSDRHQVVRLRSESNDSDDSEDSETTVGRMLQTIRRQERAGIASDSGDVFASTDRDGPSDPHAGPLMVRPPTAYEALLQGLGVMEVNSDGLRVLSDAGIAKFHDFVGKKDATRGESINMTVDSARTPFPAAEPCGTGMGSASVPLAPAGDPPASGNGSSASKVTFVGKSPLVSDENGRVQYVDAMYLEHCAQHRRLTEAATRARDEDNTMRQRGMFDAHPLPSNPYAAHEIQEVKSYDDFGTVGFQACVGINAATAAAREEQRLDGDMFAHLSSGTVESEAKAHAEFVFNRVENQASAPLRSTIDEHSMHRQGGERSVPQARERAYTPRVPRPARASRTSIADPSKLGKPRPQDQVYAAAVAASSPRVSGDGVLLSATRTPSAPGMAVGQARRMISQAQGSLQTNGPGSSSGGCAFQGGLPYVQGPMLTEREQHRHTDIPLPRRATFTHADIARASGVLTAADIEQQEDIWRAACFHAADLGWDGVGCGPDAILGPSSAMEGELRALYVRAVYAEAQAASDARRLAVLGIDSDGNRVQESGLDVSPGGGLRGGAAHRPTGGTPGDVPPGGGFGFYGSGPPPPPPGSSSGFHPPPFRGARGGPPPPPPPHGVSVRSGMLATPWKTTGGKLVSELSRLEAFSGEDEDWLTFKEDVFRVAGVNDLEQVLEPDYYQSDDFDARDNKLMYFLLQKAVSGSLTAHAHFKKARLLDGNGAYFELLNAYTMAAPAKAMLLLQELNLFRMEPGERLSVFGARLLKLFEDISLLEGENAIHFKATQKLNYLLSAIRHEPELKETYVFIEQSQSRGTITFEEALTALTRRCESLRADQALAEGAGGRRQGFVANAVQVFPEDVTQEDCESLSKADLVALITTRNKRHQMGVSGDTTRASSVTTAGTPCIVKDCKTLCLVPICPIHYAEMVCGKTPRLPLKRSWGYATYDAKTRKTIFPSAVPVAATKRVRTQRPKKN
jgi:hypothetical protein